MHQKLCPGFVEDANAIDRRDTHDSEITDAKDHQVINGHLTDRISRRWIGP